MTPCRSPNCSCVLVCAVDLLDMQRATDALRQTINQRGRMKASEITEGHSYVGVTGGVRRIISDADSRSPRQRDHDEVTYEITGGPGTGSKYSCTKAAFAKWAVRRVETDGVDGGE